MRSKRIDTNHHIQAERLLPVLVHIQTHLDEDLSLETLAERASLSSFHFHRVFANAIGETVKQYTQRLRLEQAAYALKIRDLPVTELAFSLGYQSHETFTRAFHRRFGVAPRDYRQMEGVKRQLLIAQSTLGDKCGGEPQFLNQYANQYRLSKTTIQAIHAMPVAFIRQLGAYTAVDVTAFDRLIAWAQVNSAYDGANLLIGVGHDDPNITPVDKVRFDACITLARPLQPSGEIGYQVLPAGLFAVTTYIGPYGRILEQAYGEIFQRLYAQPHYEIIGIPALEIYRTTRINPNYALNHTDIYLPVQHPGENDGKL